MAVQFKRVILITGSTDGIGRQTALELAARNKTNFVIIHGRNEEKCKAAINYIMDEIKLDDRSNLDYVVADFSDLIEVVKMTEEVIDRFPKLNVLVCNAGVLLPKRTESRNGLELTFQVNHVVPYILARKLTPLLVINKPSRVVMVSSICYNWHPLDWNDMESCDEYEKYVQYSRTKLMLHMTTFELSRLMQNSGVACVVLEPGVIETKLLRAGGYHGAPVEQGSYSSIFCVESDDIDNMNGAYIDSRAKRVDNLSKVSCDTLQQEKLWEYTEKLCEKFDITFV